jgi:hypothetical protein
MSKGDKDARVLQDATGAKYTTCLARVRALRALVPIPMETSNGQRFERALDSFMQLGVEALPDLIDGQTRCVNCLRDLTPVRACTCL